MYSSVALAIALSGLLSPPPLPQPAAPLSSPRLVMTAVDAIADGQAGPPAWAAPTPWTAKLSPPVQDPAPRQRSWMGRHPELFGALVGFGAGFAIGYLAGEDEHIVDTRLIDGPVGGAIGAGVGAGIGAIVRVVRK